VQQEALARVQTRLQDLDRQLAERRPGGFLSGLFGDEERSSAGAPLRGDPGAGGLDRYRQPGGGFLAGAMQTALGVAGGFLIADALTGLFAADQAAAAAPDAAPTHDPAPAEEDAFGGEDPGVADGTTGGDFDFGEF
jgi:uncharacterized protein